MTEARTDQGKQPLTDDFACMAALRAVCTVVAALGSLSWVAQSFF